MDIDKLHDNVTNWCIGLMLVGSLAFATKALIDGYREYHKEYLSPNRIVLDSADLNHDGRLETILKVDNKSYLLMNKNDKPTLYSYKLVHRKDTLIIEK